YAGGGGGPKTPPPTLHSRGDFAIVFSRYTDGRNEFPTFNVTGGEIVSLYLGFPEPALMRAFEQGLPLDYVLPPP
ncbi:MAG: hypothetical protein ACR2HN_01835, partial [Tepidiformaceae bacterium]